MILEISISNTLSIRDKTTLSFEAFEGSPHTVKMGNKYISLVKCLYGDNASGKTNLISAINFYLDFMINSFRDLKPEEGTHLIPFKFNSETPDQPGAFEMTFFIDAIKYEYQLSIDKTEVKSESLSYTPNGQKALFYQREKANVKWGTSFTGAKKLIADTTRKNCSLISVAAQFNNQTLLPIYSSIVKCFKGFVSPEKGGLLGFTLSRIEKDESFKMQVLSMLKNVNNNSNITDIKVESQPIPLEYLQDLPPEVREKILKRNSNPKKRKAKLIHTYDTEYELPFELESRGTQRLLELATPLFDLTRSHSFVMVDELETSLHQKTQEDFIKNFLENTKESQLLFTTHNMDLMDSGLFSDSEIGFALKDSTGNTTICAITDFNGVRKGVSRKHLYEAGKFDQLTPKVRK
jgi:uncharacterized protein